VSRPRLDRWWLAALAAGLLLRAYHSTAPLLGTNAWRQSDNAMVARNYARHGYDFLSPRVDWGGGGVVQMEFPLCQYAVALLYGAFGERDWYGRWLSILASLGAVAALYALARRVADLSTARWAAFFLATLPLNAFYGRAFMVEAPMLCCMTAGLLAFDVWACGGGRLAYAAAAVLVALAGLLKPTALCVGAPMLWIAWRTWGARAFLRPSLWGLAGLILAPVAAWYAHAASLYAESGLTLMGDWRYGTDKWGNWSLAASAEFWNRVLMRRLVEKHLTWAGLAALAAGLALASRSRRRTGVIGAWLAGGLACTALAARGAYVHEHYQLLLVPPAAFFMALGCAWAAQRRERWARPALAVWLAAYLAMAGWRYAQLSAREDPEDSTPWRVAAAVRRVTAPDDLVAFVNNNDITDLYLADRRGWGVHIDVMRERGEAWLAERMREGARFLAGPHELFVAAGGTPVLRALRARHDVILDDGRVFVMRLRGGTG
jgi:4-amino-4-deoxy-L-arabinose transferase-like glycosyltransferase